MIVFRLVWGSGREASLEFPNLIWRDVKIYRAKLPDLEISYRNINLVSAK